MDQNWFFVPCTDWRYSARLYNGRYSSCSRVLVFLDPLSSLVRGVTRLLDYQIAQVTHTSSSTTCSGTNASSAACVVMLQAT